MITALIVWLAVATVAFSWALRMIRADHLARVRHEYVDLIAELKLQRRASHLAGEPFDCNQVDEFRRVPHWDRHTVESILRGTT